jgi:hypothetical protein
MTLDPQSEGVAYSYHGMSPICFTGDAFIKQLHFNLYLGASIQKHFFQAWFQSVIWLHVKGDTNVFGLGFFRDSIHKHFWCMQYADIGMVYS